MQEKSTACLGHPKRPTKPPMSTLIGGWFHSASRSIAAPSLQLPLILTLFYVKLNNISNTLGSRLFPDD